VLAQGPRAEQQAALHAVELAQRDGAIAPEAIDAAAARIDALAQRFPGAPPEDRYTEDQRGADESLMRHAWARALTAIGEPRPPARTTPLRVVTQARVDSDGVSEAGLAAEAVQALFANFDDVEFVAVPDLSAFDSDLLRSPGRLVVLVGNQRARYKGRGIRPGLHLALWNPFQVLDVDAPAIVSWGYAEGALRAVQAWLEGRADAPGVAPVALAPGAIA
jgi:beta-N-acetylhexosaminidase